MKLLLGMAAAVALVASSAYASMSASSSPPPPASTPSTPATIDRSEPRGQDRSQRQLDAGVRPAVDQGTELRHERHRHAGGRERRHP